VEERWRLSGTMIFPNPLESLVEKLIESLPWMETVEESTYYVDGLALNLVVLGFPSVLDLLLGRGFLLGQEVLNEVCCYSFINELMSRNWIADLVLTLSVSARAVKRAPLVLQARGSAGQHVEYR
jgi:hypothetical protein